jgi:hypothetical protein
MLFSSKNLAIETSDPEQEKQGGSILKPDPQHLAQCSPQKTIKICGLRRLGRHHCCEASPNDVEYEEYFLDPAVGRYDVGHLRIFHQLQAVTLAAKI